MKTKLTLSVDKELVEFGKAYAKRRGTSLSKFLEEALQRIRERDGQTFSEKWRGKLVPRSDADDPKLEYLLKKYG
jgi:hypothetical protein